MLKRRKPLRAKKGLRNRKPMRRQSAKARREQGILNEFRESLLRIQRMVYGEERCEAQGQGKCFGNLELDHVLLRRDGNKFNIATHQILCHGHNTAKGSKRTDFRPEKMRQVLQELADSVPWKHYVNKFIFKKVEAPDVVE